MLNSRERVDQGGLQLLLYATPRSVSDTLYSEEQQSQTIHFTVKNSNLRLRLHFEDHPYGLICIPYLH